MSIIESNLRSKYAKTPLFFHYMNDSLNITSNVLFISCLGGNPYYEKKQNVRDIILKITFQYLEVLYCDNANLKASTLIQIFEILEKEETPKGDALISYLLFIREWITENTKLLEDVVMVSKICSLLLECLVSQNSKYNTATILIMEILPRLTKTKEKIFEENQNTVLSLLFSHKFCSAVRDINGTRMKKFFDDIETCSDLFEVGKLTLQISKPQVRFVQFYLAALNACIEGCNSFTENFCQKLFTPSVLHHVLKMRGLSLEVKHAITDYILEAFLKTNLAQSFDTIYIIEEFMKDLIDEFDEGIKTLLDQSEDYAQMADVLIINEMMCVPFETVLEKYLAKISEFFETVVALELPEFCFESLSGKFEKNVRSILNILDPTLPKLSIDMRKKFATLAENISKISLLGICDQEKKEAILLYSKHSEGTNHLIGFLGRKTMQKQSPFESQKQKGVGAPSLEPILKELSQLGLSTEIKNNDEDNFKEICDDLMEIDEHEWPESTIQSISSSLLYSLSMTENIHSIDVKIYMFCIRLLKYYIDKVQEDDVNEIKDRQTDLVKREIVSVMCRIFCGVKKDEIRCECIGFFISLLKGGNKTAQMKFLEVIENDKSGAFFSHIYRIINSNMKQLSKIGKIRREEGISSMFAEKIFDNVSENRLLLLLKEKDLTDQCTSLFRFLQLLCEGHNNLLQTKMQQQGGNFKDVNFLSLSVITYGLLQKFVDEHIEKMLSQILDFLIESLQGPNRENQDFIFRSKFFEFMNDYMLELDIVGELKEEYKKNCLELIIKKSVGVVNSLLDGNTNRTEYFVELDKFVRIEKLMTFLSNEFTKYLENNSITTRNPQEVITHIKSPVFDEDLTQIFQTFFLIKYIVVSIKDEYQQFFTNLIGDEYLTFVFFEKHSSSIEIIFNDELELIFFILQPASTLVSEEDKQLFLDTVRRDTHINKLSDLLSYSHRFMLLMDNNNHTGKSGGWFVRTSQKIYDRINKVIIWTTFIYAILMFFIDNYGSEGFLSLKDDGWIFVIGRYTLLIMCIVRILVYCIAVAKVRITERWGELFIKYKRALETAVIKGYLAFK